jgi:hypothetical protein
VRPASSGPLASPMCDTPCFKTPTPMLQDMTSSMVLQGRAAATTWLQVWYLELVPDHSSKRSQCRGETTTCGCAPRGRPHARLGLQYG